MRPFAFSSLDKWSTEYLFKSIVYQFADDTNLLFSGRKLGTVEPIINHKWKLLGEWLESNKLSLSETELRSSYQDLLGTIYYVNHTFRWITAR